MGSTSEKCRTAMIRRTCSRGATAETSVDIGCPSVLLRAARASWQSVAGDDVMCRGTRWIHGRNPLTQRAPLSLGGSGLAAAWLRPAYFQLPIVLQDITTQSTFQPQRPSPPQSIKMRVLSILALACGVASAAYPTEVTSYSTSTQYLTATVTLTQCNPANPECPLYVPPPTTSSTSTTSSSIHVNTTSSVYSVHSSVYSYAVHNTTSSQVYPTAHLNSTAAYPTTTYPTTKPQAPTTASPSQPTIPVGAAGALSVQSGLLLGVLGLGAALLA
ncbi:hypothetical protein Micbo1qcDRAFT_192397 [Microdochium bolleyi]|uniref:Uncharacterized protein n=1 Tax=Microdochium bolleyi TaxID=196109 RepID=A0A136JDX8_9PEZI|nr:hypothetical protein Micbo1qcDRAFT_192397 [Microdochium bolleyi]